MTSIEKTYDPPKIEQKLYDFWMENGLFHAEADSEKEPYCIMMPPPNVTGILHMGHALQSTIQDMLIRYHRMRGKSALWMPGTDHAGIATQNVVERKLKAEGIDREDLGRELFVKEVWDWKEKHGNIISDQQRKLGSSCDWERERFTMDEGLSRSVMEVFVKLYDEDLIYKGKYIVNWCPVQQTALSDEEVFHKEHAGHLWHLKYPLADEDGFIAVATTRPETMLGDTAVAVNPEDERYAKYIGKEVMLPVVNRRIPVIADEFVDKDFGTGAVKVTPAHDPNDFEIGKRHNLPFVIVIDERGAMTDKAGSDYVGLDRFVCRKKLIKHFEETGILLKVEDHSHSIGYSQRSKAIIEPLVSDQWFLKMKPLAEKALKAVQDGDIKLYPHKWEKNYYNWMENIRDWCISRQLWWGHRIPVWYEVDGDDVIASVEPPEGAAEGKYKQEKDVLDTWFSSWLWPFSTLNWPEENKDLDYFYPTSVLVSGYDIIFFWIARMIMAGLWFTEKVPFTDVYFTGMIKDEKGQLMSKSLGNGIDPIEMIDQYGADAVRYSLTVLNTDGQDIKLATTKFEMGRNFANKIWNSFRFLKMKEEEIADRDDSVQNLDLSDKWIMSRLHSVWKEFDDSISRYKMSEAATKLYSFFWGDFCDWYIEIIKQRLNDNEPGAAHSFNTIALPVFKKTMELLHPIMPYITEEIWQNIDSDDSLSIMICKMGTPSENFMDKNVENEMALIQSIISAVRNIRSEMNIAPSKKAEVHIKSPESSVVELIKANEAYITSLAKVNLNDVGKETAKPAQSATAVVTEAEIYIPLAGLIDIDAEKKRLQKELDRIKGMVTGINKKLSNDNFVKRAPEDVVAYEKEKLASFNASLESFKSNLTALMEE